MNKWKIYTKPYSRGVMEMTLQALLQSFASYASAQQHLEPLLPLEEKVICFRFKEESCSLKMSCHEITLLEGIKGTDTITFWKEEDLHSLVSGLVRLQLLLRWKGTEYIGSYRTLLLAESLFHICKPLEKGA